MLAQTFSDWELIITDDGSSDDSVAIAQTYADRDPRIQVHVNSTNLGTYGNEARAFSLSSGELVAILNSDDFWDPAKLEKQVAMLDANPSCAFCYVRGAAHGAVESEFEEIHADWPTEALQHPLVKLVHENRILASGVIFRREALKFETSCRYSGDWVILLRAARDGCSVAFVDEPLTYWRLHDHNTFRFSPRQAIEEMRLRRSILADACGWPGVDAGLARCALDLQSLYVFFGARSKALSMTSRFARHLPMIALKRTILLLLPMPIVRKRLWPKVWHEVSGPAEWREWLAQLDAAPSIAL